MAKSGRVNSMTDNEKNFEGTEVEGRKAEGFDKTGASCVVTHRNGPKKVWFRDGKEIGGEEIGVEDAG